MRSLKGLNTKAMIKELAIVFGAPVAGVLIAHLAFDPEPGQLINVGIGSFSVTCVSRMIIAVRRLPR